jgi:membrane-associated protein
MSELIDLLLHVDRYLLDIVSMYGPWVYALLFVIVFAETGLVVTPILPGDSLLFAAGAIAATGALDIRLVAILLLAAAIAGDAVNYSIGRAAGLRILQKSRVDPRWRRWVNPVYIDRAHEFFERHGGKAIVLGRFMPIVRTFVVAIGIVFVSILPMLIEFIRYRARPSQP